MPNVPSMPRPNHAITLPLYLLTTFAISWGGLLLIIGPDGIPGRPEDVPRLLPVLVAVMLLGPTMGAIIATASTSGRAGLSEIWSRVRAWRVAPQWYVVALLTAPVIALATLLPLWALSPVFEPGILTADSTPRHLVLGFLTGIAAGTFEEIGWTGVAIPAMRRRLSPTMTGLVLGVIWGLWHLVASSWGSFNRGDVPLSLFLLVVLFAWLVPYRILMVWVYERTRSVFVAMVMHGSLTATLRVLDPIGNSGREIMTFNLALGAVTWCVVAVAALKRRAVADGVVDGVAGAVASTT